MTFMYHLGVSKREIKTFRLARRLLTYLSDGSASATVIIVDNIGTVFYNPFVYYTN